MCFLRGLRGIDGLLLWNRVRLLVSNQTFAKMLAGSDPEARIHLDNSQEAVETQISSTEMESSNAELAAETVQSTPVAENEIKTNLIKEPDSSSVRLLKLEKAFDFALASVFKDCSLSEIQRTLIQLHRDNPRLLEQEYFKFKDNFIQLSKWEFNQLLSKLSIPPLLKQVDDFKTGIISNDPVTIVNSKRFKLKKQEHARLKDILAKVSLANKGNSRE